MDSMITHKEWIENRLGKTVHAVALDRKEDPSNFAKKVRRGLTADQVIEIARLYRVPVVEALKETGFLKPEEVDAPKSPERIAEAISYLDNKLSVQVKQPNEEEKSNVHPFPNKGVEDDFYDYNELRDSAYPHQEIGGNLDDLDP